MSRNQLTAILPINAQIIKTILNQAKCTVCLCLSDMLTETSTEHAPWYVIPADNKWFMRYAVADIICDRIEALDLQYPQLSDKAKKEIENARQVLQKSLDGNLE